MSITECMVKRETTFKDGSAWIAIVKYSEKVTVCAEYVAGELKVNTPKDRYGNPSANNYHLKQVKEWAKTRVSKLSKEWHTVHNMLYM